MPGYQRKFTGQPPSPPHWCALCRGQATTEGVEYFIETGVFAEHEGVIYLCNKCFEPLVLLSEKFIALDEHKETLDTTVSNFDALQDEVETLHMQAALLHDLFGLRLADLIKFKDLTNKLDHLNGSVGLMETRHSERSAKELLELQEVQNRKDLIASLDSQIEAKNQELQVHIESSLTTKLEHIGRADLIPILLNNQLPESITSPSDGDEREIDENSGESDIPGGVSFAFD